MNADDLARVTHYHDETKHHVNRFARALGYLDWATQPRPFRAFDGAATVALVTESRGPAVSYDRLFSASPLAAQPIGRDTIGDFLRHALGLSAWKVFRDSRWSLRVNPSSGNLHPTEAYLIAGSALAAPTSDDLESAEAGRGAGTVWHYAPDRHVLELRCQFDAGAWPALEVGEPTDAFLVALTSIHWRESWKYGERAFRYCQHDLGHAVAALRLSAALLGWRAAILPAWSHRTIAVVAGVDRDEDYVDAEREEPACMLLVSAAAPMRWPGESDALTQAVRRGRWSGRASQLSEDHVQWTFIDEVAVATSDAGRSTPRLDVSTRPAPGLPASADDDRGLDARVLVRQRRSALALDAVSSIGRAAFLRILQRVMPHAAAPWDALWWTPHLHLALFVHRVDDVEPGVYLLPRSPAAVPALRSALSSGFLWQQVADTPPLWLLERGECRVRSKRVSCDQDIAADGYFSLGMLAEFDTSLREQGAAFYRQLFWESGAVGQVLYLEAEAAGARGTGIGCFYDDSVHELLGLKDHAFQSLYHFTIGTPVEDRRLTTEPAY